VFDRRFDLDAEFLFVLPEPGKFNGDGVVAGDEAIEVKLSFRIGDALRFFIAETIAAQRDDDTGKNSALIWYVGNNLSLDAAALGSEK